jgi:hypothetical protein
MAAETLATRITDAAIDNPTGTAEGKIAGQSLRIELRKA